MSTNMLSIETYVAADAKTRARMRADIKAATDAAVRNGDFSRASDLVALSDAIRSLSSEKSASTFDVNIALSDMAATYEAAAAHIRRNGGFHPGTVNEKTLARLTTTPARKSGRGDVIAWVESVVDDTPATIAQLRARWVATEDYPEAAPSSGAIGAAFNRVDDGADADFTVVDVDGKRGAVA